MTLSGGIGPYRIQVGRGAYTTWTGILNNRLISKLETVDQIHGVGGGDIITALIKECRGPAACVLELFCDRHVTS